MTTKRQSEDTHVFSTIHNILISSQCSGKFSFYRAMLCIRVLAMALSPSVCLSQVGVLLKWLNVQSHKQHQMIAQGLQLSDAKDLRKIRPGSPPLRGLQMQLGWVKIGDYRQITGYISKMVQDRRMVSIKVE